MLLQERQKKLLRFKTPEMYSGEDNMFETSVTAWI
jgi:hypothetical protein